MYAAQSRARGPHGTSEHSSRSWPLAHKPFRASDSFGRGLCCCPFHNAHDGDTAVCYQGVPCLRWSLYSRFVGKFLMDCNRFEFKPLLSVGMLGSLRRPWDPIV